MAKDDEKKKRKRDDVVDLASRIGARREAEDTKKKEEPPPAGPPPPPARFDAPIPAAPKPRLIPTREDRDHGALIRKALIEETATPPVAIPSPRGAPGAGEIDLVATLLPTPDDWQDRKRTLLNSIHRTMWYAVFCFKKYMTYRI